MDEKTVVNPAGSSSAFLYREDYLLFGMLVRHNLCEPADMDLLVSAQSAHGGRPSLMALLAESSSLSDKNRRDMQELLNVLATPKLRELLPNELPEARTLIQTIGVTMRLPGSAPTVPIPAPALAEALTVQMPTHVERDLRTAATMASHGGTGSSSTEIPMATQGGGLTLQSLSGTHLTAAELERIQKARSKGKLIGEILAGHLIVDRLGSGGQGDVYLAKQLSLNRYVALKKLEVPGAAQPELFVDVFRKEAQTLGAINHARIVKVYEIFVEGGSAFFTMEYLNGKTLKELVSAAGGSMPLEVVANLACQACSALSRTAQDGLVHRDIKPANILVDENGDLKIVDFGLAAAQASLSGDEAHFTGTPQFAAPEQAQLKPLTPLTDQYSLGLTLYFCLTGEMPMKGRKMQDVLDQQVNLIPPQPSQVNTNLPRSVDRVIMRMIAKDPADRYPGFDECFSEWETILTESGRGKLSGTKQLLGESLLRFSRSDKNRVVLQSSVLFAAWSLLALGTVMGEFPLRRAGLIWVLEWSGQLGTYILVFSLSCIAYVALARRGYLPILGSLRAWLYTHIATAVLAVILIMIHSGNFIFGIMPGPPDAKPILSLLMATTLLITAISGSVGLMIFRGLRRTLQIQELELRGTKLTPREQLMTLLSAELLSGWRLVHYPLAVFFVLLTILHIVQTIRFSWS